MYSILLDNTDVEEWVMKAPFTSNSQKPMHKIGLKGVKHIMAHIATCHQYIYVQNLVEMYDIKYILLQERAGHPGEVKPCFLGMKFSHIVIRMDGSSRRSLPNFKETQVIAFAYQILQMLDSNAYILDGLVRVDVMLSNSGTLVVNELESLDAVFYSRRHSEATTVTSFLNHYWEKKIFESLQKLLIGPPIES